MTRQFSEEPTAGADGTAAVPRAFARRTAAETRTPRHRRPPTGVETLPASVEATAPESDPGEAVVEVLAAVLPAVPVVLTAEDEALVRQVRELRGEADRARRALADAGREREDLRRRLAEVEAERDQAAAHLLEVERVRAIEDAVRQREEHQAPSESESAALHGHIDDLQRERDHLAGLMAEATSAAARTAEQQRSDATAHATQLTALIDALRADASAERARHEQSLADARGALEEFREKAAAEIGEWRTRLEQAAHDYEASVADVRTRATADEQARASELRIRTAELETERAAWDERSASSQQLLADLAAVRSELEGRLAVATSRALDFQQRVAETLLALAEQGEEADKRVAAAEQAAHEVQRERDRAIADVERLSALIEAAQAVSARDAAARVQAERERDAERQQWNETFARLTAIEEQVRGAVSSRTAPTLDRPVAAQRPRPQRSL